MTRLAARVALLAFAAACAPAHAATSYDIDYTVEFLPDSGEAAVTIALDPGDGRATRLDFAMDPEHYRAIEGDGEIERDGKRVTWVPPRKGGDLRYRYKVNQERRGGGYDALMTKDWAILRGDDLVPRAVVRATRGADSRARLRFVLPKGWTNVDTPYVLNRKGDAFVIVNPARRFDRPVGWLIAGDVGTRREWIEDMEVSIAGPRGEDVRRNDLLAFINATAPEMRHAFGRLPTKVLILGAGNPMWRGGLSGPRSLFLHADRPTISENGTSTLMHELTHVITRIRGVKGEDWIAEGLAEFYSITLLHRAGLISDTRHQRALRWMQRHGKGIKRLTGTSSRGERTARAVTLFAALDAEIRTASAGRYDLDNLTQDLMGRGRVSIEDLRESAERLIGAPPESLNTPLLD
jgi:predicted metalloprotease with PDZ domain